MRILQMLHDYMLHNDMRLSYYLFLYSADMANRMALDSCQQNLLVWLAW